MIDNNNHDPMIERSHTFEKSKISKIFGGIPTAVERYNEESLSDNKTSVCSKYTQTRFLNNIYFNIKNNTYEVSVMWCLIITTIILLLSLLIKDADDLVEAKRVV